MTDIAFYHLQRSPLEVVLPRLLEKTLEAGKRALVMAGSEQRVESLNGALWTANPNGWMPHGSAKDGSAAEQPIWLTHIEENPNKASFLFLTDGADVGECGQFERCFDLFDGNDQTALVAARARWSALKDSGHTLTYWQQSDTGRWEQKG